MFPPQNNSSAQMSCYPHSTRGKTRCQWLLQEIRGASPPLSSQSSSGGGDEPLIFHPIKTEPCDVHQSLFSKEMQPLLLFWDNVQFVGCSSSFPASWSPHCKQFMNRRRKRKPNQSIPLHVAVHSEYPVGEGLKHPVGLT